MNSLFKILATLLLPISIYSADIYVSQTGGDDGNTGTQASPYKTIGKAITSSSSGDVINVKSGTYREKLNFTKDDITLQGVDDDVYITGTNTVTNWETVNTTTYKSYQPDKSLQLFVDGKVQTKAKFPNQTVNENLFEFTTFSLKK